MGREKCAKGLDSALVKKYSPLIKKERPAKLLSETDNTSKVATAQFPDNGVFSSHSRSPNSNCTSVSQQKQPGFCPANVNESNDTIMNDLYLRKVSKELLESHGTCHFERRRRAHFARRVDKSPLAQISCTGQRLELQGDKYGPKHFIEDETAVEPTVRSTNPQEEQPSVAINQLYSSLKRLKSRHETVLPMDDVRVKCSSFPFKNPKTLGHNQFPSQGSKEEEIFILLGGKSKPVRFEVNPDNLNLLESEFGIKLKSKAVNTSLDQEDFELLRQFRDKYRSASTLGNTSSFLPWARHSVCRQRKPCHYTAKESLYELPSATYNVAEEEFGRKLSIHVYLPNVLATDTQVNS